ncbi:MAG: hypothetical protein QW412_00875 [Candidatus Aenigmatarchaeota archaeon]
MVSRKTPYDIGIDIERRIADTLSKFAMRQYSIYGRTLNGTSKTNAENLMGIVRDSIERAADYKLLKKIMDC